MRMEAGLDTGPVYLERRVAIGAGETAGELSERLQSLGGALLVETLEGLRAGRLQATPQSGTATVCRTIRREDALVDWERSAAEILRRLRAFTPWPGLYTFLEGERVKILEAAESETTGATPPGTLSLQNGELVAAAGAGTALRIGRLQRAGRNPVTGAEFARAARLPARFGSGKPA